jgi:glutamyl-tRNA synthetase
MNKENKKVVTRFAPSPTGFMHVGGLRTALYAWLYARKHGGTFILRIEDTDKEREVLGSIEHIIESIAWLGMDYGEGPDIGGPHAPYIQSQRLQKYREYAQILIDKGYAYPDPYTEEEINAFRKKAEEEKRAFLYREHRKDINEAWDGSKPLRFKVPHIKRYEWHDLVYGDLSAGEEALDDFILIKSDGYPTYNFAHIVDDIEMGVTHVMRGQEFISSTPKFLSVYEALGYEAPLFATLPPILAEGGNKKLGKRDGAKDILEYRTEGYLPNAMMNFLALLGWNPGTEQEIFTPSELINVFDIEKVGRSGAQFNDEKLDWVNREHLKALSYEDQEEYINKYIIDDIKSLPHYSTERLHAIVPIIMERVNCGTDIEAMCVAGDIEYFFKEPKLSTDILLAQAKELDTESEPGKGRDVTKQALNKIIEILGTIESWTNEDIKNSIWDYATETGRGQVLWPMRYALSGREKSPDPFVLAEVLGKDESIIRLQNALQIL